MPAGAFMKGMDGLLADMVTPVAARGAAWSGVVEATDALKERTGTAETAKATILGGLCADGRKAAFEY